MLPDKEKLDQIEKAIKQGHFSFARKKMSQLDTNRLHRSSRLRASNLARRCGELQKSLKILSPIVRELHPTDEKASDDEVVDYAYSLNQAGLYLEAEKLLKPLVEQGHQGALFYGALVCFTSWDYQTAKHYLQKYISQPNNDPYRKMIATSNLVSCHIYMEEWDKAQLRIDEVLAYGKENSLGLLINLSLEQQAELYVHQDKLNKAIELLNHLQEKASDSGVRLNLWIEKWRAIALTKMRKTESSSSLEELRRVSKLAFKVGEWEVCRDLDYFVCRHFLDQNTFDKLYCGTPYKPYRQRLINKVSLKQPNFYEHHLGGEVNNPEEFTLNMQKMLLTKNRKSMQHNFSKLEWKLLSVMCLDLYKPIKMGELFGYIFEEEYYNPFHSPNRIYQIIHRFNQKMKAENFGLKIIGEGNGYQLISSKHFSIQIGIDTEKLVTHDQKVICLAELLPKGQPFKASDVESLLSMTARTASRWLKEKVEAGEVIRLNKGKNTRYKIAS